MYEPDPITEEVFSIVNEEVPPMLYIGKTPPHTKHALCVYADALGIDYIPYSDETEPISSPESSTDSSEDSRLAKSRPTSLCDATDGASDLN